jgi:hypothetical protein
LCTVAAQVVAPSFQKIRRKSFSSQIGLMRQYLGFTA